MVLSFTLIKTVGIRWINTYDGLKKNIKNVPEGRCKFSTTTNSYGGGRIIILIFFPSSVQLLFSELWVIRRSRSHSREGYSYTSLEVLDCELFLALSRKHPVWWFLCLYKPSKCPLFKRSETTPRICWIQCTLHDLCCSILRLNGEIWDLPLGCWRFHILLTKVIVCVIPQMVLGNLDPGTYSTNV